tara:strand:- start:675 stop:1721 length:1047 start_codon:yes stop_codon:yes gene_type:complete
MSKEIKYLSASRIKTLENCSQLYWVKYGLGLPDKSNSGALRGTLCHNVFECLLNPRHKKHFSAIKNGNSIKKSKVVDRYVLSYLKRVEIEKYGKETFNENYELVDKMIVVGLKNEFFGNENALIEEPEVGFEIQNEEPKYNIKGYIDKPIQYKEKGEVTIVDYKSSKAKFRGEELHSNVQAMMYSLASRKLWPDLEPSVEFLFLRFPRQPLQKLKFNKDQLDGFEYYLEQANEVINSFDEKSASSNYAADNKKNSWLCAAGATWVCPYRDPFVYYSLVDENGKQIKSSFENDFSEKDLELGTIKKKTYSGCPRFHDKDIVSTNIKEESIVSSTELIKDNALDDLESFK